LESEGAGLLDRSSIAEEVARLFVLFPSVLMAPATVGGGDADEFGSAAAGMAKGMMN
jgi:hypothetical protein